MNKQELFSDMTHLTKTVMCQHVLRHEPSYMSDIFTRLDPALAGDYFEVVSCDTGMRNIDR